MSPRDVGGQRVVCRNLVCSQNSSARSSSLAPRIVKTAELAQEQATTALRVARMPRRKAKRLRQTGFRHDPVSVVTVQTWNTQRVYIQVIDFIFGRGGGIRTHDADLPKIRLWPLSYTPAGARSVTRRPPGITPLRSCRQSASGRPPALRAGA